MDLNTFRFLGHNCFLFQSQQSILVTDPWFSDKGAFFGSWYQYPKNHHLVNEFIQLTNGNKKVFIYLSHEHQDHFDLETLNKLNKKIFKW
jgi:UDP-MurNAc hydroxylase